MRKIGLLSDTHGFLDPKIFDYFKDVDEIWVLKDGVIDAIGNYDSLMGSNALFKDLSGLH